MLNLVHVLVVCICLTSEPDCIIITPLPLQIGESCHYDDPRQWRSQDFSYAAAHASKARYLGGFGGIPQENFGFQTF